MESVAADWSIEYHAIIPIEVDLAFCCNFFDYITAYPQEPWTVPYSSTCSYSVLKFVNKRIELLNLKSRKQDLQIFGTCGVKSAQTIVNTSVSVSIMKWAILVKKYNSFLYYFGRHKPNFSQVIWTSRFKPPIRSIVFIFCSS